MSYLVLLACSAAKRRFTYPERAMDVYDGPTFRVLRRAWYADDPQLVPPDLACFIVSARYGLIGGRRRIEWYDQRLTPARAAELAPQVGAELDALLAAGQPTRIFIHAGALYREVLADSQGLTAAGDAVIYATGRPGQRLAQLKAWLLGLPMAVQAAVQGPGTLSGGAQAQIRPAEASFPGSQKDSL